MTSPELTAAIASADRQKQLVADTLNQMVDKAASLLITHGGDETRVWAVLGMDIAQQLDLHSKYQQFSAEMLAVAAIKMAQARIG